MQKTDKKIDQVTVERKPISVEGFASAIIPKSLQLGGLTIEVLFQKHLDKDGMLIGLANYAAQQIRLDPTLAAKQMVEQTYLHELTHWILFMTGERELCNNEKFVDLFAHFLYQALTTAVPYQPPTEENDNSAADIDEIDFSDEERLESLDDSEDPRRYCEQEEDAIEEEHHLACQEAGGEDAESYREGLARSDDEGWFYGEDD